MSDEIVLQTFPLGFPWQTVDPFLFCVHHDDNYPAANEHMGPAASLAGRNIGMDFEIRDGWRMYHGDLVPGFPRHPHRGFETVTVARRGFIDHSDSLGATARFGRGDVQWMTAGRGIEHSEMFPLLDREGRNRTELFQIWLNLPRDAKMVDPYFTMLWADRIPRREILDEAGRRTQLTVIAGAVDGLQPLSPPPSSWASRPESDVAIWTLAMEPNARWVAPRAHPESSRVFYLFEGEEVTIAETRLAKDHGAVVRPDVEVVVQNGGGNAEILMLQGRSIGEPVAQHGPFVMNTQGEIREAMLDYRNGTFGEWRWGSDAPVHPRDRGRFAIHADGHEERPSEA